MPSNKNAFNRYLILDELLSDRFHNYTIDEMRYIVEERLGKMGLEGVGRRCIEKDIVNLQYAPVFADIERYKSKEGKRCVRYADPLFSIFTKKLSKEERNLLCEVLETIGQFDGLDNFEWLEDFKEKLGVKEHERIIYFSNNPYLKNSNLLGTLFTYIANKVVVLLTYRTFSEDAQREIVFHPYLLKQYNNRWYVIGAADSDDKILTFALDRIINVNPLPEKTYRPCNEDVIERYEDIIGITYYENELVEEIVFWTSDKATNYIDTKPIHGSQKILKEEMSNELRTKYPSLKGGKFYSINCIRNYELIRELTLYGKELLVISPSTIQEEVFQRISEQYQNYLNLRT